jgi:N-methylhydantoinase B
MSGDGRILTPRLDALELEIFRYAVESVVDELELNIQRTAHTPLVYEFKDFCCGIVTRDFRLLSQSRHSLPIFLADLGLPVQDAVEIIGEKYVEPGDIFVTNFNPVSGSHLNNVLMATPLYADDRICGYLAIKSHWADVGGLVPGSQSSNARSLLHEGVQYRGIKVVSRGRLLPEVVATIEANSWLPRLVAGDVLSFVAACTLGVRRWQEQVLNRWHVTEIDALTEAQFAASAELARMKVNELPDGKYLASCVMDDSGQDGSPPLRLSLKIDVKGSKMVVDLSDLPPQVAMPINSGTSGAKSAIRVGFKSLLAPERPADYGLFEPLEIVIPEGTVMSAQKNAPMSYWNTLPPTLIDLFLRAIGERLPDRVPAGHFGTMSHVALTGQDAKGTWWRLATVAGGGFGGSAQADGYGPLPALMLGDNPAIPIELREGRYAVRYRNYRLRTQSGGLGLHRGGPGLEQTVETLTPAFLSTKINRTLEPAWGLAGGQPGRPGEIHIRLPDSKRWRKVSWLTQLPVPAGTLVRMRSGGGGGWGRPH